MEMLTLMICCVPVALAHFAALVPLLSFFFTSTTASSSIQSAAAVPEISKPTADINIAPTLTSFQSVIEPLQTLSPSSNEQQPDWIDTTYDPTSIQTPQNVSRGFFHRIVYNLASNIFHYFPYSVECDRFLFSKFPFTLFSRHSRWFAEIVLWYEQEKCRRKGHCYLLANNTCLKSSHKHIFIPDEFSEPEPTECTGCHYLWDPNFEHFSGILKENRSAYGEDMNDGETYNNTIPQYVFDYAPLVHLYSKEEFWPCDVAEHLNHTLAHLNYTPIRLPDRRENLNHIDNLNHHKWTTFLTSDDNVEDRPAWLGCEKNKPITPETHSASFSDRNHLTSSSLSGLNATMHHSQGGHSSAPATLIVVHKGDGVVDAFWFYFYSFNLGQKFLGVRFGNHVGDWEHTAIRFHNGTPSAIYLSQHVWGEAFDFSVLETRGARPVLYSAAGTHAMYATPGEHRYALPWGVLSDVTDKGPLWDPALNVRAYTWNNCTCGFRAAQQTPDAEVGWLSWIGKWGDKAYPVDDPRQYGYRGMKHYVDGPVGPVLKKLGRKLVCQKRRKCYVQKALPGRLDLRVMDWRELRGELLGGFWGMVVEKGLGLDI